jgi:4-azaleucine resistance transporter AzlC
MERSAGRREFLRGFRAMVPLWLGVVPFGLAYAVTARSAGLSLVETQALSVLVFAGSAQISAAGLFGAGTGGLSIVLTTFLLNVRHVLYGVSLARTVRLTPRQVPVAAYFLTDEAFGVATAARARSFRFLLGTELSLFVTWNLATLVGAASATVIPDPTKLGVDVVFPLAFLALLVPLVRRRIDALVAVAAGGLAWLLSDQLSAGLSILLTGAAGSLLGAWATRNTPIPTTDEIAHDSAYGEVP